MKAIVTLLILFCVVMFAAFSVLSCFQWSLGPLYRAARHRRDTGQFTIADFLCLFVLVQIAVGIVHWIGGSSEGAVAADVVVLAFVAMLWWSCVRTLNRAGIRPTWHRCVVLVAVMPTATIGSVYSIVLALMVVAVLSEMSSATMTAFAWFLLGILPIAGAIYAAGRFTRKIVVSPQTE
jgi:hypothetical protein